MYNILKVLQCICEKPIQQISVMSVAKYTVDLKATDASTQ